MSETDVTLFQTWAEQVAVAENQLDFMYEEMWAEDVDHRAIEGAPDDHGPISGREAMRSYVADWYEMFPDLRISFDEVIDGGPQRVVAVVHVTGTARGSGVPTDMRVPILYTIRGGRVVRGREYLTIDGALRAAGLVE